MVHKKESMPNMLSELILIRKELIYFIFVHCSIPDNLYH